MPVYPRAFHFPVSRHSLNENPLLCFAQCPSEVIRRFKCWGCCRDKTRSSRKNQASSSSGGGGGEGNQDGITDEEALSNITKQKAAAAKQYIENHYKEQMKNLQDRKESFEDLVYQSGPSSWPSSVYAQSAIYPMAQSAAQMTKGFSRVEESFNDLAFDVPDARKQFLAYVEKAKTTGCLDSSFHYGNSINDKENGVCQ